MLTAIAEEHPVILVVDDLHLADDVSLAVLHLVMRRAGRKPLMVILLARPGELTQSGRASKFRESAPDLNMLQSELQPLTDQESQEMLKSLIPTDQQPPSGPARRALVRAAAGYPMVLELLVQDWQQNGEASLALSIDAMTEAPGPPAEAYLPYKQILERITRSLDATTHNVLNLASVLGHRVNDLRMYGVVDLSVGQTMGGMAELVTRRVLRDGAHGLEFVNEMVRGAAYLGVPISGRKVLHSRIADRLVDDQLRGESDLGLEIAWHCIRAGRSNEAIPFLLSGAREAMRRGALESAERALSTVLPHLFGGERADAVVLLGDILQEQGRWMESLSLVDSEAQRGQDFNQDWLTVLTINSQCHLGPFTAEETTEKINALVQVISESGRTATQIAAALTATTLGSNLRDKWPAKLVLASLPSISRRHLSQEDLCRLSLVKARLMYQMQDSAASLREIEGALATLDLAKAINTASAHFQLGLGCISCKAGEYTKSCSHLEDAYAIAVRLGNDTLRSEIAVNLSLGHGRLGNYDNQLRLANETLSISAGLISNFHVVLAAYCGAVASIFRADMTRARAFMSEVNTRVGCVLPQWGLQAWDLYRADLHFLLGDKEESRTAALSATAGPNSRLHSSSFAGAYCRWIAMLPRTPGSFEIALEIVRSFAVELSSYDALDKAEILASLAFLQRRVGDSTTMDTDHVLISHLKDLPPAVSDYLARLQILE